MWLLLRFYYRRLTFLVGCACGGCLELKTQTMKMMYAKIAETLREVGPVQAKPTDYLNFYCLGTKETFKPGEFVPQQPPDNNSGHVSEHVAV